MENCQTKIARVNGTLKTTTVQLKPGGVSHSTLTNTFYGTLTRLVFHMLTWHPCALGILIPTDLYKNNTVPGYEPGLLCS